MEEPHIVQAQARLELIRMKYNRILYEIEQTKSRRVRLYDLELLEKQRDELYNEYKNLEWFLTH